MQIIIDIPKKLYEYIKKHGLCGYCSDREIVSEAIANGKPLKGHGRLIDADEAVLRICGLSCGCTVEECGYEVPCFSVRRINSAPTIIDKEQES